MTPNRSLAISMELKKLMRTDLLRNIDDDFPFELIEKYEHSVSGKQKRDRVFNAENTLLTMIISALCEDKSLKQAVNIFKEVFELKGQQLLAEETFRTEQEKRLYQTSDNLKKRGRPRLFTPQIKKSKIKEVSDNTAAFSKARARLDSHLVKSLFEYSADFKELNGKLWHGMRVGITDGTYFQMQDEPELRKKYYVKQGDQAYPQGLLQCIVQHGSGQILNFTIGTRHQSELELVKPLIEQLSAGYLLLADDLYNSYAIFSLLKNQGCHIIVAGKRERKCRLLETLSTGDEIIEIDRTNCPPWLNMEEWKAFDRTLKMRKISYPSPDDPGQQRVIYTSLVDPSIRKEEIILKYTTRWDIEITIREIKSLLGVNVARSKTEEMVFKEITIALTAYNMIRKLIAKSVITTEFSPQSHFFKEYFEADTELLMDKKGRVYHQWSPGRYGKVVEPN